MAKKKVVIVGAGVIGTACAYYLARSGWSVTMLDAAEFGKACSHGNCGLIVPSHLLPLAVPGAVGKTVKTALCKGSTKKNPKRCWSKKSRPTSATSNWRNNMKNKRSKPKSCGRRYTAMKWSENGSTELLDEESIEVYSRTANGQPWPD